MTTQPNQPEDVCPDCGHSWDEHEFGVPTPYCPQPNQPEPSREAREAAASLFGGKFLTEAETAAVVQQAIDAATADRCRENEGLRARLDAYKRAVEWQLELLTKVFKAARTTEQPFPQPESPEIGGEN